MPRPLNIAIIGCGQFAQSFHLPNIARSAKATLHTACDTSTQTLDMVQKKFHPKEITTDFKEAIVNPEVDAICLATTEQLRLPVIELAASLSKPIYCEKPLAKTLPEMYAIQKIVHESKIKFCVGHNRRSSPAMLEAHRIFRTHMNTPRKNPQPLPDAAAPGMSVRINDDWHSWKHWVFDKQKAPHGPMLFEMTHFTDMCNWFLAADPLEVTAMESGMLNQGVVIRYTNGAIATISMSANGTLAHGKELYEIFGNGGAVIVDHMLEVKTAGIKGAPERQEFPMYRAPFPDKGWANHLHRFMDEINGGPKVCGVDEAISATKIAFAAIKSAQERRVVKIEEV